MAIYVSLTTFIAPPPSPPLPSPTLQYGGEEHLSAPPKELLLAQTEQYVEYSRSGAVIKGQERARVKSRYEEDVYINNHTVGCVGNTVGSTPTCPAGYSLPVTDDELSSVEVQSLLFLLANFLPVILRYSFCVFLGVLCRFLSPPR